MFKLKTKQNKTVLGLLALLLPLRQNPRSHVGAQTALPARQATPTPHAHGRQSADPLLSLHPGDQKRRRGIRYMLQTF